VGAASAVPLHRPGQTDVVVFEPYAGIPQADAHVGRGETIRNGTQAVDYLLSNCHRYETVPSISRIADQMSPGPYICELSSPCAIPQQHMP